MNIAIIYWTSTGNTEKMAHLIGQGIQQVNEDSALTIKPVAKSEWVDIEQSDIVLLGCSAMGVEEIDTSEMEPFIKQHAQAFADKSIALFGSYGWGDGEWMQEWEAMMDGLGAKIELDSLIVNELPEGASKEACIAFGQSVKGVLR